MGKRTGGRILVDSLLAHGAELVFCVPGESFLGALDALADVEDRIRTIVCRQEGGAANMAEAYGKLTGRPGLCFVTRGPGVTNASIGLHTARQDSTPMILLVGQVGRDMIGREAFQEIDYRRMLGEVTKWVDEVQDPARIPEYVARAYAIAMAGRRGPVALIIPEDVLTELAEASPVPPSPVVEAHPAAGDLDAVAELLARAKQPLAIVGGSGWSEAASADLARFAAAWRLPVVAGFRCQDRLDNTHPSYVGELGTSVSPALGKRVREADLILAIGERLGEMTTSGYELVRAPVPTQTLIHVHPGAEELGRVFATHLPINAAVGPFLRAAALLNAPAAPSWAGWTAAGRADFEAQQEPKAAPGAVDLAAMMTVVRDRLGPDAILTNGAGNYTGWLQRYYRFRRFPTQLGPVSGAMGYGFPAAIAAKVVHPDRDVVCFAGDGCFLMTGQEMATAVKYRLGVVVLVIDNGMYGTIRMHQERNYPERAFATDLANPDFAAYAHAFGAHGETVRTTAEFAPAFERALAAGGPALVHVIADPQAITTRGSLDDIRARALAGQGPRLMRENAPLRIGTRGSRLALWQANAVRDAIALVHAIPPERIEIIPIRTSGDVIRDRPLSEAGGKGLFSKELEAALLERRVDIAVHSAKDMETFLPAGLMIGACLPREDVRDALIARPGATLETLPEGARIGTASLRREAMLKRLRPDVETALLRGNVPTRVASVRSGAFDATLLALAGLKRLGLEHEAAAILPLETMPPACGQGAVAIECRQADTRVRDLLGRIDHAPTSIALACERAYLAALDGSCRTPVAGYARIESGALVFDGLVLSPDGSESYEGGGSGSPSEAVEIGRAAGEDILRRAPSPFLMRVGVAARIG